MATIAGNRLILAFGEARLLERTRGEAVVLAESMALSFLHTLIYEELGLVEEGGLLSLFIEEITQRPELAVKYVEVVDPTGRVIAHSDYREYGRLDSLALARYSQGSVETLVVQHESQGQPVLEVATPLRIGSRSWGTLVLAVSLESVYEEVDDFASRLTWMSVAALAVCMAAALLVARALAGPVKDLAGAMGAVGPNLETDLKVDRGDEVGLLQKSFLDMLGRLRTARDERERTRQAMVRAERLAAVGTLASGVAHEVNNPLAGVKNCLAQMEARPDDRERHREYRQLMAGALDRIEQVTRGLLDFSRRRDLEVGPVDLGAVTTSALDLLAFRLERSRVEVVVAGVAELPVIRGDRHQLEQVVVNLALNAIDSMADGGRMTIRGEGDGGRVRVSVEDSGEGIPADLRERIFDPFFTTKEPGRGTGLGLTVSLNIAREHGGDLECGSTRDGGGSFTLTLPLDLDRPTGEELP